MGLEKFSFKTAMCALKIEAMQKCDESANLSRPPPQYLRSNKIHSTEIIYKLGFYYSI